ncbi:MAG: dihydrodipicolinate synthase family protein [Xanthobacteraceae bacterium]|nr:dihydrodipicolinate synthase family protein [Xanthobacteraceae bacterium]MCW5678989.1 dihydrodipicolinate synthase family protein [Xanthobacteraceae bacterium]
MTTATGIWPPAATPFREDLSIDTERYVAFCHELLRDGAHGLAVLGTTSEANSLDFEERKSLLEKLVASGINPAQLLPGTGAASFGDAVKLTSHAANLGVKGSLLLPPFYYKGVSDEGLFEFVSEVIARVKNPRLRLYLYNFPQQTGLVWSPELIAKLRGAFPETVVGIKDSSGDAKYLNALLEKFPGFAIFPSSESLMVDALGKGAAGCISASANTHVKEIRALYDGWKSPEAAAMNERASAIRALIVSFPLIAAVKATLAEQHKHKGWQRLRPPLTALTDRQAQDLRDKLAAL